MEIKGLAENGSDRGTNLPVHYLRLLAPPLQLLSAAVWQVVQQGLVDHYGMLEEFVTMVTELVPELMSYSQRAQLIMGLRAKLVLEMCRGDHPADIQTIQPHLDRIKAPISTAKDPQVTINQVEESEVNFVELVHSLLEDPSERKYFFQECFPDHFGSKFETALEMLVWEFISRLDELLPVPDFTQLADLLGDRPSVLDDCLQSFFPPEDVKAVLEHHRRLGHFKEKDPRLLPMDDCILSSLSLPLGAKSESPSSCSPALKDSNCQERAGRPGSLERAGGQQQQQQQQRDASRQLGVGRASQEKRRAAGAAPCDNTIDLTASNENADSNSGDDDDDDDSSSHLRKRKLSQGSEDVPAKRPSEVPAFLNPSEDDVNTNSPLISIWGDYTDSQGGSLPVVLDTKAPWSDEETLHLLDIWGKDSVQRALKGCLKNRHIFTQIAQKMTERGYMRSVEQCQTRIKRLKKYYRQNKNSRVEYRFSEQLERILGSSAPSAGNEITYDIEDINEEEEESQDGDDDDLQFVSQTSRVEVGTRSSPWTDSETLTLIKMWAEDSVQQELRIMHRTGNIFSVISSRMSSQGFSRTPEQCQTRLKRVKSGFRQCYQNNLRGEEQVHCKFYNELGRVLVNEFQPVPQLDEAPGQAEERDFNSSSRRDTDSASGVQEDRKKVPWSDKETIILLEVWGDQQVQRSIRRYPHNGHIFTEISEKLGAHGFSRSAEQCHSRIKRLKTSYRQCQESMSSSGTDRVDFKFYDLLEQILDKQPSTSAAAAAAVSESIEISEDSDCEVTSETNGDVGMSAEKRVSSVWTDEEALALIEIWGEEELQRSLRGFVHNGYVYAEISERMQDLGYSKTPEQCRWKVKSLRNNFRQCYDKKKSGRKVDYKFYNPLEQILGQEAVSLDEYDEKDEQADQDAALDGPNAAWTDQETVALVEVWAADDVQHNLKTCVHNSHIFVEIAEKMASMGYLRTAEQFHARIKRLKKTYRRYCNNRRNGRPAAFRYFNLLAPVLGDKSGYLDVDVSMQTMMDGEADLYEQPAAGSLLIQADPGRRMPWSEHETRTLLRIWGEDTVQLTLRGSLKNRHVFEYISEKMNDNGFTRTTDQCYTRIKRLKYGFHHEKEDFKFFAEMNEIFRKRPEADSPVPDTSVSDEPEDCTIVPEPSKVAPAAQWTPENAKQIWSDSETEALLEIWCGQNVQDSLKGSASNRLVYTQIAEVLVSQGYMRTPDQCQNRIKRLKANFRQFLEGKRGEKQECKFFEQLVPVFGSKYMTKSDSPADDAADGAET
ncbi:uncharacterized protein LOC142890909 isoform X2 [Nelusetta ayraudi]|uniref:uncharacterized protein LOC142890909 isoform X2 n=1 Tax=Nelusetta ayraudi TaxID=303726 RepID=UPI003F6EC190